MDTGTWLKVFIIFLGIFLLINNADTEQTATVKTDAGDKTVTLSAFDTQIVQL